MKPGDTPAIAIDFGTTRTKVAFYDAEQRMPRLIELGREVRAVIPSLFYIPPEGTRLVGDDAQVMVDQDPTGIIIGLKREIHRPGKIRSGPGRPSVGRVELASDLFTYIRQQCESEVFHQGGVTRCTLTVPVSFEEQKRDCIRLAAEMGGFDQVSLVEEPIAAARAWFDQAGTKIGDYLVVCDVGGGTTDFALLRYDRGQFETMPDVPTDGFGFGGNDVDEDILAALLNSGIAHECDFDDQRAGFLIKLRQAKELFSRQQRPEIPIRVGSTVLKVSRKAISECARRFTERVAEGLKRFLSRCPADAPVLLVGGGSRLSGLKEAIETFVPPNRVYQWNQADYATVLGAVEKQAPAVGHQKSDSAPPVSNATWVNFTRHIRTLISDGRGEQAFAEVAATMAKNANMTLFDLWEECANVVADTDKVLAASRELHRRRAADVWSSCCLAMTLSRLGRDQEAQQVLQPFETPKHDPLFPVRYARFLLLAGKGNDQREEALLNSLLKMRVNHPTLLLIKALRQLGSGQEKLASTLLNRALQSNPNDLLCIFSETWLAAQNPAEGVQDRIKDRLKVMQRISPTHYWTRLVGAQYLMGNEDYHRAKHELDTAAEHAEVRGSDISMALVLRLRAMCHQALNSEVDVRRDVEEWVRRTPQDSDARFWRAQLRMAENRLDEAVEDFSKGLELTPDAIEALISRGWCFYGLSRSADARNDFEAAHRLNPTRIDAKLGATLSVIRKSVLENCDPTRGPNNLYIHPDIPQDKLKNAMESYAARYMSKDSVIALLFDDTFFGGAGDGFAISEDKFMAHNLWETDTLGRRLGDIQQVSVRDKTLVVDGFGVSCSWLPEGKEGVHRLERMLRELVTLHQGLDKHVVRMQCPKCRQGVQVRSKWLGQEVKCPHCPNLFLAK